MRDNICFVLCLQWTWREIFEGGWIELLIQCWFIISIRCLWIWLQAKLWDALSSDLPTACFCLLHGSLCLCAIPYNILPSQTYTMTHWCAEAQTSPLDWRCRRLHSLLNSIHSHNTVRLDFTLWSPFFAIKWPSLSSCWVANLSFSLAASSNLFVFCRLPTVQVTHTQQLRK